MIYVVDYPRTKIQYATAYGVDVKYDYESFISCPQCRRRVSGALWKRPRQIKLSSRKVPDFLYIYSDNCSFLLSEKAWNVICAAQLTGIQCFEQIETVSFQRKAEKEIPIPVYYHIELARSCITINHEKSKIVYGQASDPYKCPQCRQLGKTYDFFRYLSLNMEKYEGYDIFHTYEMGDHVFLSQKFVDTCTAAGLTNLHFSQAESHGKWIADYFLDNIDDA